MVDMGWTGTEKGPLGPLVEWFGVSLSVAEPVSYTVQACSLQLSDASILDQHCLVLLGRRAHCWPRRVNSLALMRALLQSMYFLPFAPEYFFCHLSFLALWIGCQADRFEYPSRPSSDVNLIPSSPTS